LRATTSQAWGASITTANEKANPVPGAARRLQQSLQMSVAQFHVLEQLVERTRFQRMIKRKQLRVDQVRHPLEVDQAIDRRPPVDPAERIDRAEIDALVLDRADLGP
jgi:hypothetical protein